MRDEERAKVLYLSRFKFCEIRMPATEMATSSLCIAKITRNTRKTRVNRRSFLGKKKRKEELQLKKLRLGAIYHDAFDLSWLSKKKKLVSNYLVRMHLRFYAQIFVFFNLSIESVMRERKEVEEWSLNEL